MDIEEECGLDDEDKDNEISTGLKTECHGKFTCTYTIPTLLLDVVCDGMRREMRLQYICGKKLIKTVNFYFSSSF